MRRPHKPGPRRWCSPHSRWRRAMLRQIGPRPVRVIVAGSAIVALLLWFIVGCGSYPCVAALRSQCEVMLSAVWTAFHAGEVLLDGTCRMQVQPVAYVVGESGQDEHEEGGRADSNTGKVYSDYFVQVIWASTCNPAKVSWTAYLRWKLLRPNVPRQYSGSTSFNFAHEMDVDSPYWSSRNDLSSLQERTPLDVARSKTMALA